jgi:PKD repeat protein
MAAIFFVAASQSEAEYPVVMYHGVAHVAQWRSKIFCHNAEPSTAVVLLELVPRGTTSVVASKVVEIQPEETLFLDDIYQSLKAPDGVGTLRVTGNVLCFVRTYNLDEENHSAIYGANVPPYNNNVDNYKAGEEVFFLVPVAENVNGYRSNLLLYNPSNHNLKISIASDSTVKTYLVGSLQYVQLTNLGAEMGLSAGLKTLRVVGDASWWGYISIFDPVSGDREVILGLKKPQAIIEKKEEEITGDCTPPLIISPPQNTTLCSGQSTTLSVTATGIGPLHYEWYSWPPEKGGELVGQGPTHQTKILDVSQMPVLMPYWVRVVQEDGCLAESRAIVKILPTTDITEWWSVNKTIQVGGSTTLYGTITGYGTTWTISQVGGTGSGIITPSFGSGRNVAATFTATGNGSVTLRLTATGACGRPATQDLTISVSVQSPPLFVTCSADPQSGVAPLDVAFTSTPSGGTGSYSYSWNFGDGGTSTSQNPTHQYVTAGNYTATVTVSDGFQSETCSQAITVTAPNHAPSIDSFTANPNNIFTGDGSNLTATTGDIDGDTVSWTLSVDPSSTATGIFTGPTSGTGNISSQIQATAPGNLVIRLDASDGHGGTATATVSITVNP